MNCSHVCVARVAQCAVRAAWIQSTDSERFPTHYAACKSLRITHHALRAHGILASPVILHFFYDLCSSSRWSCGLSRLLTTPTGHALTPTHGNDSPTRRKRLRPPDREACLNHVTVCHVIKHHMIKNHVVANRAVVHHVIGRRHVTMPEVPTYDGV